MIQFLFIYAVDPSDNVYVKSLQSLGSISYFYTKRDIQSNHQITMKRNIVLNFVRARTSTCYAPSLQLQVTVLEADTARTG